MSRLKLIALASGLLITGLASSPLVQAEPAKEGVGVSPASQSILANPGQTVNKQLTVINEGNQPLKYHLYANNFTIRNQDYEKDFNTTSNPLALNSWLNLPQGTRQLAPKAQEKFDYSITIPKEAISQGYYGVIFAETTANQPDTTGVVRIKRVGMLVYIGIKGGLVEKGHMVDMTTSPWQLGTPVKTQLRLQNDGNVFLGASGTVQLKNIFGQVVGQTPITGKVIPSTIRRFKLELPAQDIGLYRVEGNLNYGNHTSHLPSQWVLVASPLWLAVCGLVIIGLASMAVLRTRRRIRRKR